jgi:Flp pilus assembly protein TadG
MSWFQLKSIVAAPFGAPPSHRDPPVGRRPFRNAKTGNVTILFAMSLIPMIGLVGLGIDYGVALSDKAKLDSAADTAVLAAVATAKAYIAANSGSQSDPTLTNNAKAAGYDRGMRAFAVNAGALPFAATPTPTLTVSRTGQTFSANVSYSTSSNNNFGRMFGQNKTNISGSTGANADIPSYVDFYLLIDVSGSMGLPSTTAGQSALISYNNCQFACHFPGSNSAGYNYANSHNIQLRSGAVNTAVCGLLSLAAQPLVPNQYRVGIYPFVTQMGTLASITSNISTLQQAATCNSSPPTAFTTLLDTGSTQLAVNNDPSTGTGSGGTHFENAFPSLKTTVSPYGDGSSATNSRPFVFLVTDGMENTQYFWDVQYGKNNYTGSPSLYSGYNNSNWTGSNPLAMTSSWCTAIKNAGATVSILYIPYTSLTLTSTNQSETQASNNAIPNIPTALLNCASPGYFSTANTPADISNTLAAMFAQAIQAAHLVR